MENRSDQAARGRVPTEGGGRPGREGLRRLGRRLFCRNEAQPFDFDALARDLAQGLSRREALRRLGGAFVAVTLGAVGAGRVWGNGNSDCAHFCIAAYPPGPERGACVSDAAMGAGLCWACHADLAYLCVQPLGSRACCAAPHSCCEGQCFDLTSNAQHCGSCGTNCAHSITGTGSQPGCCGSTCVDLSSSAQHCGACGNQCANGTSCVSGQCRCTSGTLGDNNNCGTCGNQCTGVQTCCSGKCVDTSTDNNNCGGCGVTCLGTTSTCCSCRNTCLTKRGTDDANCGTAFDSCSHGCSGNACFDCMLKRVVCENDAKVTYAACVKRC